MEIIIVIAILAGLVWWFYLRAKKDTVEDNPAPYKIEAPAEQPEMPVVEGKVEARVNPVALALDVDTVVLPAKKPRKPRAPKPAEAPVKPAAKKAAPKKVAAKKPAARTAKSKKA